MTFAIDSRAKAMQAQGIEVCNFGVGEPDFDTPKHVREAAKAALDAGRTRYGPPAGIQRLRELIAEKLRRENGLPYTPGQIVVTTGGKQALVNVVMAILSAGAEALIPAPYWVTYPEIVKLAYGVPVFVPTTEASGFKVTPEHLRAAITPKTRLLILNSPSNPTGAVYSRDELTALAEVLVAHNIAVIADEIYEKLIYDDEEHVSIGSLNDDIFNLTITCNGLSKAFAATGWRLGYAAGPEHVIKAAIDIQSQTTSCTNTFAQYGAIAALEGPDDEMEAMRRIFEQRRDVLYARLCEIPGLHVAKPLGAFYIFPNIGALKLDSIQFCERLLEQEHVALVPGAAFGADANVRISYATDLDTIERGVAGLARFVRAL